jgi:hypothetical protein
VEAQDLLEMGMKKLEVKRLTDATGAVTRRDAWGLKLRLQLRLLFTAWGSATWRAPRACVCVCVCGGGGGTLKRSSLCAGVNLHIANQSLSKLRYRRSYRALRTRVSAKTERSSRRSDAARSVPTGDARSLALALACCSYVVLDQLLQVCVLFRRG